MSVKISIRCIFNIYTDRLYLFLKVILIAFGSFLHARDIYFAQQPLYLDDSQPGESKDVKIVIGRDALSFYDEKQGAWTAEPGTFTALVGNASDNIVLKRSFILK